MGCEKGEYQWRKEERQDGERKNVSVLSRAARNLIIRAVPWGPTEGHPSVLRLPATSCDEVQCYHQPHSRGYTPPNDHTHDRKRRRKALL